MRVVFAGTPPFAARALEAILAAGYEIPLVLTQPDRPAGRGLRLAASAVAELATARGIRLEKPQSLRDSSFQEALRRMGADVMVVAAYGLLLPAAVLGIPPLGCLNIHASLLPRWRGAAPIQRAILAGDERTGVSIMRMDEGLDTGAVLLERPTPIGARETTGSLTERLARLGADAIVDALHDLERLEASPQDGTLATHAPKIAKAESRIDWNRANTQIDRAIRAFNPSPGAETGLAGAALKIWKAEPAEGSGKPGEVLECDGDRWVVAAGTGALALVEVQKPGGKRLRISEFLRGVRLEPGAMFDSPSRPA